MKLDFSIEKVIAVILAIAVYFLARTLQNTDWIPMMALVLIVGWGPDLIRRFWR